MDYGATASDRSEVKVDDSRPLDSCTVDEAVEKIGFGVFQVIVMLFSGLIWVSATGVQAYRHSRVYSVSMAQSLWLHL